MTLRELQFAIQDAIENGCPDSAEVVVVFDDRMSFTAPLYANGTLIADIDKKGGAE